MKKILIFRAVLASFCFILLLFLLFPQKTFAVTTIINNYSSSISTEPFTIEVSVSGAQTGTNYLRADLYKEGTQNYFGETYNGSAWYGGSVYNQYFPIAVQAGATASASFQAKLGNPSASEYGGVGNYKLRIRRYTSSSYNAGEANNSSVPISIITSTPTPTPTSTPSPSPISSPTPTPTPSPTLSPTPSPTKTSTPKPATPKPTVSSTPSPSPKPTAVSVKLSKIEESPEPIVLPAATKSASTKPSPTPKPIETKVASENNLQKILIAAGLIFIISSGFYFFRSLKKNE